MQIDHIFSQITVFNIQSQSNLTKMNILFAPIGVPKLLRLGKCKFYPQLRCVLLSVESSCLILNPTLLQLMVEAQRRSLSASAVAHGSAIVWGAPSSQPGKWSLWYISHNHQRMAPSYTAARKHGSFDCQGLFLLDCIPLHFFVRPLDGKSGNSRLQTLFASSASFSFRPHSAS